jgi:hypothetical protein
MLGRMPGLPDDWRPPARVHLERAWDAHPQRDLLNERKAERDGEGMPCWEMRAEPEEGDPSWVAVWLRSADPRDSRPDIRITRYPASWEAEQNADAQAIADEHADD